MKSETISPAQSAAASPTASTADAVRRAEAYRLLAMAFAYPDTEDLVLLLRDAETTARAAAQGALADMAAGLLQKLDGAAAGEYNRLFAQGVAVTPYETSYVASDKGAQLGLLAALYEAFGVRSRGEESESPDHIGSELEFLSFLCLKEAVHGQDETTEGQEAHTAVRAAQEVFLREHLGCWVHAFSARVLKETRHPFYSFAAHLLTDWIDADLATNGWQAEPGAVRFHLPLVDPDRASDMQPDVQGDDLSCPMADPSDPKEDPTLAELHA